MSESFNFKQWLFSQKGPYTVSAVDEDHVHVDTKYGLGEVNFYHLDNEPEIVELRVTCRKTNLTKFIGFEVCTDNKSALMLYGRYDYFFLCGEIK